MKATIESTDRIVDMRGGYQARVWEGVTESGVSFIAYIPEVEVKTNADKSYFEAALRETKRPSADTSRAIDARFIL